ncbi:hypothetical protein E2C01_069535 [Portunus trituberculatus]|uniref:Reverse transcriptase domain-containing protein n=1 Tax=Portunus trituberculatus TaxID=210409 RepID=A0A5B7HQA8_PORTR|nr:hypothetical protein [Portunus trituberculatus]
MPLGIKSSVSFRVPGNPLLQLYNLYFHRGQHHRSYTETKNDKFSLILLTSCFSKVFEHVLLAWLMHRLQDKLSPNLYCFLPCRSTHHCLTELYTRLSPTSVVSFLDLKSAFDSASRDVILDQQVEFGVQGNLRWIRGYLCNRVSHVLFKGACSAYELFELSTPQGGVLSLFLFNGLMHSTGWCSEPLSL